MTRTFSSPKSVTMPVGIILRRARGATRWAKWIWSVTGLLPGAGAGNWLVLGTEGDATDYHAATVSLTLYRTDTEAYLTSLNGVPPSVFVILRPIAGDAEGRPEVLTITASAYEAQDYADNGEDIVERVQMPDGLRAWIGQFTQVHHTEEAFIKRKRRDYMTGDTQDGIGDARVRQTADVFRAPRSLKDQDK
jgi:hypothetical protein